LKDEPKPSFNQVPLFVSHTLTSDSANTVRPEFMPQTSQKEVTVRLRGKFAFQIAGIENRLAGLMQAGFAGINHEIYRTLV
jgi:hypothetical protein